MESWRSSAESMHTCTRWLWEKRISVRPRETLECVEEAEYNAGYELFPDDAAYQDEMDRRFMMQEIRIRVHEGALEDLDLEQMRRIYELVAGEAIGDNTTD